MIKKQLVPRHVAIIMDGNGRWAQKRNLPRIAGHRKGVQVVEQIIEAADEAGVGVLTLYAFSTENWNRPRKEIDMLLRTLDSFLSKKLSTLERNGIQLRVIGAVEKFPRYIRELLADAQKKTKMGSRLILNLALNYGSRDEILRAVRKISDDYACRKITQDEITEELFSHALYTDELPDPDLLIRTSGEQRISNFMLWQLSYAELYFCDTLWPDFKKEDFNEAITDYQRRERRFGGVHGKAHR